MRVTFAHDFSSNRGLQSSRSVLPDQPSDLKERSQRSGHARASLRMRSGATQVIDVPRSFPIGSVAEDGHRDLFAVRTPVGTYWALIRKTILPYWSLVRGLRGFSPSWRSQCAYNSCHSYVQ